MTRTEFFHLPDEDPAPRPDGNTTFGQPAEKYEGAPCFRDDDGYLWFLAIGREGARFRALA